MMIGSAAVPSGLAVGGTAVGGTAVGGTTTGVGVATGPHAVNSITAAASKEINTKTFFIFSLLLSWEYDFGDLPQ
jgi:hypothetical protein